ncbi:MAG: hypothetical protein ACRD0J_10565 [Acidimicrobiales bacterium]
MEPVFAALCAGSEANRILAEDRPDLTTLSGAWVDVPISFAIPGDGDSLAARHPWGLRLSRGPGLYPKGLTRVEWSTTVGTQCVTGHLWVCVVPAEDTGRPGELTSRVFAALAKVPGRPAKPEPLGRSLDHSPGAVAYALGALARAGAVERVSESPKSFAVPTHRGHFGTSTVPEWASALPSDIVVDEMDALAISRRMDRLARKRRQAANDIVNGTHYLVVSVVSSMRSELARVPGFNTDDAIQEGYLAVHAMTERFASVDRRPATSWGRAVDLLARRSIRRRASQFGERSEEVAAIRSQMGAISPTPLPTPEAAWAAGLSRRHNRGQIERAIRPDVVQVSLDPPADEDGTNYSARAFTLDAEIEPTAGVDKLVDALATMLGLEDSYDLALYLYQRGGIGEGWLAAHYGPRQPVLAQRVATRETEFLGPLCRPGACLDDGDVRQAAWQRARELASPQGPDPLTTGEKDLLSRFLAPGESWDDLDARRASGKVKDATADQIHAALEAGDTQRAARGRMANAIATRSLAPPAPGRTERRITTTAMVSRFGTDVERRLARVKTALEILARGDGNCRLTLSQIEMLVTDEGGSLLAPEALDLRLRDVQVQASRATRSAG